MVIISTALLSLIAIVVLWLVAHALLIPKPIPGIPYKRLSYIQPWGDLSSLGIHSGLGFGGRVFDWFSLQCVDLKSPLVQVFIPSMSTTHPVLILSDLQEIEDVVRRRTTEVDRADIMHTWFGLLAPKATISLKSKSETYRVQRSLWNVILSPTFLNQVAARNALAAAADVVRLWSEKAKIADGLPFEAQGDIQMAMFDSSWRNLFGSTVGVMELRCKAVTEHGVTNKGHTATFNDGPLPEICGVLRVLFSCLDWVVQGITPRGYAWLFRAIGLLGRAERKKNLILDDAIRLASSTPAGGSMKLKVPRMNAIKLVLEKSARKEGRQTITHEAVRDEALELLLTGGQSTTSALLLWALKYLMDHIGVQEKLRDELNSVFADCTFSLESTANTLASRSAPYLDAVIAETLRLSATGPICFRQAVMPCTILGHQIPAGTPLLLVTAGPSYNSTAISPIPDDIRSRTSQRLTSRSYTKMTHSDRTAFDPDRWLVTGEFDQNAVPMLPFSAGPRGCFGRSIAMLEMRIFLIVLLMRYQLPQLAKRLRSHDAIDGLSRKPRNCFISPQLIK